MSPYFFHLRNGARSYIDLDGVELPNDESAARYAQAVAAKLVEKQKGKNRLWRIDVHDIHGRKVCETRLCDREHSPLQSIGFRRHIEELWKHCRNLQDTL